MCEPRIVRLIGEIRALHGRQCDCANRINAAIEEESRRITDRFRPRETPGLPELQRFENIFESQAALKKAREDPRFCRVMKLTQTLNWGIVVLGCLSLFPYAGPMFVILAVTVVGGLLYVAEHHLMFRPHLQRSLREQLVERGIPICLACGYDLRGQITPRCPECGTACRPSILSTRSGDLAHVNR